MKYAIQYVWLTFVAWLTLRAFGYAPEEFWQLRRDLVDTRIENDRLRVAFVRAREAITRQQLQDAPTLPGIQVAEHVTMRWMRAAARPCEYLTITPPGDEAEISR